MSLDCTWLLMSIIYTFRVDIDRKLLPQQGVSKKSNSQQCLQKKVRDGLFPGEQITLVQMRMALNGIVQFSGISKSMVENLLCSKSLQSRQGYDTFHPSASEDIFPG